MYSGLRNCDNLYWLVLEVTNWFSIFLSLTQTSDLVHFMLGLIRPILYVLDFIVKRNIPGELADDIDSDDLWEMSWTWVIWSHSELKTAWTIEGQVKFSLWLDTGRIRFTVVMHDLLTPFLVWSQTHTFVKPLDSTVLKDKVGIHFVPRTGIQLKAFLTSCSWLEKALSATYNYLSG